MTHVEMIMCGPSMASLGSMVMEKLTLSQKLDIVKTKYPKPLPPPHQTKHIEHNSWGITLE